MENIPVPTSFRFEPMTETCARAALGWRYLPPYDFYNQDPAQLENILNKSFLNPAYRYYSVFNEQDTLIAYRCFGEDARVPGGDYRADALDMGGGLRPDLTGHGLGLQVMRAAMDFAKVEFSPQAFRATVAEFNLRAQRACAKVGYVVVQHFIATHSGVPFVILMRDAR